MVAQDMNVVAPCELAASRTERGMAVESDRLRVEAGQMMHLTGHDVAMGWILAAMIAFGVAVGFIFPTLVAPFVDLHPDGATAFRIACVLAGFCVGGFAYGVARFTLFRANRRLARLAAYDGLTGLFNQRQFARSLGAELARSDRTSEPTTLIITDLDHFKRINDGHGHTTGDDLLAAVAADVLDSVRAFDVACRIGGEEFAVILPQTAKAGGVAVAERIRAKVALNGHEGLPRVTISCGVATYPDDAGTIRELTKRADDAMYSAKTAGRNAVRGWQAQPSSANGPY